VWDADCQAAFQALIAGIIHDAVLSRPDYDAPFIVQVDWSLDGLGAVLSQIEHGVERPVSFQSRSLRPPEKNH